ncbi:MAG: bifunctional ADP-heptose synthase [Bacteroidota bacterium]
MNFRSQEDIFDAFSNLKVLIIGDVMVDTYTHGKVDRISPEAPVPVLHVTGREERLGGAANVALNVSALGAKPYLCSAIGNDVEGDMLLRLMAQSNLPDDGILRSDSRITTTKQRVMSGAHHLLRVDTEDIGQLNIEVRKNLLERIESLLPECSVVIFEDYDKGVLGKELIESVIEMATKAGIPTVVDPKKRNFMFYRGASLFKPNLKELREGLKIDFDPDKPGELDSAVQQLKDALQLNGALITLSERGMYIDFNETRYHIPAWLRNIADVSGAGDTVISIAALCVALGLPPKLVLALSNLGGGLVCEYAGVVPIDKANLLAEAKRHGLYEKYAR